MTDEENNTKTHLGNLQSSQKHIKCAFSIGEIQESKVFGDNISDTKWIYILIRFNQSSDDTKYCTVYSYNGTRQVQG